MTTQRVRRGQLPVGERRQLRDLVGQYVLGAGGRLLGHAASVPAPHTGGLTPAERNSAAVFAIDTLAGPLTITPFDPWVLCRFANPRAAAAVLEYDARHGRLNTATGQWTHDYRRVTAGQAVDDFARRLGPILKPRTAVEAANRFVGWLLANGYSNERYVVGDAASLAGGEFCLVEYRVPDDADRDAAWRQAAPIYLFGLAITFDGDLLRVGYVGRLPKAW